MRSLAITGAILQILGFALFVWIFIRILMIIGGDDLWTLWEIPLLLVQALVAKFMTGTGLKIHLQHSKWKGVTYD